MTQIGMLDIEEKQLAELNGTLVGENERLHDENKKIDEQITKLVQKIKINNLLKDIDLEEM